MRSPDLTLRGLDLESHLQDPSRRQRYVTRMFDIIAPRYDRFTRLFSYAMDARWKRELLARLPPLDANDVACDLACGTGDLAVALAERTKARVLGIDASSRMVEEAARRRQPGRASFAVADMTALPLGTGSTSALTAGYGFRNVPDLRAALTEAARVLRPGGRLLVLDFYRPRNALWRRLFLGYLRAAGNLVGWLWHGEAAVYGYIAPSIEVYMDAGAFVTALERSGFRVAHVRERLGGGIALHVAVREPGA